jgi:NAD(P)-dependent dehydrogenase (short-subunit alcohol dehydrogenase family)
VSELPTVPSSRVAVVTGAAQGIGRAVAEALAEDGCRVALIDVQGELTEDLAAGLRARGLEAQSWRCDVSSKGEVEAMVAGVFQSWDAVHILVNNAALFFRTPFEELSEEEWDRVLAVNLKGSFLCAQAVLPLMRQAGWGRIIQMSSDAGEAGAQIAGVHYAASKAGQINLTRCLAPRLAPEGITVNTVAPAAIDTPQMRALEPELVAQQERSIPVRRIGRPEEVADLVVFLCSDRAAFITGATLDINGGALIR